MTAAPTRSSSPSVMADAFKKLGGEVLSQEAVAPTDVDMHPLLTRVATEKPDVLYFPVFVAVAAQIIRQAKDVPGLEKVTLLGSSALLAPDLISAARDAVVGFKLHLSRSDAGSDGQGLSEVRRPNTRSSSTRRRSPATTRTPMTAPSSPSRRSRRSPRPMPRASPISAARRCATRCSPPSSTASADRSPATSTANAASSRPAVYEYTNADAKTFKIGDQPEEDLAVVAATYQDLVGTRPA